MKLLFIILAISSFSIFVNAQDGRPEFYKICGDPQYESTLAVQFSGKVMKIIDGDTIVVKSDGKNRTVNLIAVDVESNEKKAASFLSKEILKKNVFFLVYGDKSSNSVTADVYFKNVYSANRSMITKGIARYIKPEKYTFSNYKSCVYQKLEEMAKEEKLGIWAK